jgi:hypothetical protein
VTKESFVLFIRMVVQMQTRLPPDSRRKLGRQALEGHSEFAAVAAALAKEMVNTMPIPEDVVQAKFFDKIIEGDPMIELAISSALAEKDEKFQPRDLAPLKLIMEEHCGKTGLVVAGVSPAALDLQTSAIERDTFELLMKKLQYDTQAYKVWVGKNQNYELAVQSQRLDWARSARAHNLEAAGAFVSQTMNIKALSNGKAEDFNRSFNTYVATIEVKHQLEQGSVVGSLALGTLRDTYCLSSTRNLGTFGNVST